MADEQPTRTTISLRPGRLADAKACGRICFEAFGTIAAQHNFPPDFPSADVATDLMTMLLSHPRFFSVVAELDGTVVGSDASSAACRAPRVPAVDCRRPDSAPLASSSSAVVRDQAPRCRTAPRPRR